MKRWIGIGMLVLLVAAPIVATAWEAWWMPFALLGGLVAGVTWVFVAVWLMESKSEAAYLRIQRKRGPVGTGKR